MPIEAAMICGTANLRSLMRMMRARFRPKVYKQKLGWGKDL
jgi:hypothetical protein